MSLPALALFAWPITLFIIAGILAVALYAAERYFDYQDRRGRKI